MKLTSAILPFSLLLFLGVASFTPLRAIAAPAAQVHEKQAFITQFLKTSHTDPASAAASAKTFLAAHADMDVSLRAEVQRDLALVDYNNLANITDAMAVLDAGMAEVDKAPSGSSQDLARVMLITTRARIFTSAGKPQQAVDLLQKNTPLFLQVNGPFLLPFLSINITALSALKQQRQIAPVVQKVLAVQPQFIENAGMMGQLVNSLVAAGKGQDALSYAKLYWMVCPFDAKSISGATNLLAGAWRAIDLSSAKGDAFLKAQGDATAANPLTAVKLPTLDNDALATAMTKLNPTQTHNRITFLLMQGKMRDAMLMARQSLLTNPSTDNTRAVLEMARVFKAADLNLVQANAFLQYFKTGKGDNPLDAFLKQYPAPPAAK